MTIKTLGIDIGKNKFHLYGVDSFGKMVLKKQLTRSKLHEFMVNLPPCLVGMEACGGAHHLARLFKDWGHDVRLMAIQHVKPYAKSYKNDFNDAAGICEAVTRPHMNFVGIKTVSQQEILALHNDRSRLIEERTALANGIRGLLLEHGLTIAQGIHKILPNVTQLLDPECEEVTPLLKSLLFDLIEEFKYKNTLIKKRDDQFKSFAKANPQVQQLMTVPGIGIIAATAFIGKVGNVNVFKNGRQLAAWLGLVPQQYSTGGKIQLGRISKRGDRYLRSLLVHGARSVLKTLKYKKQESLSPLMAWFRKIADRRGHNKGIVAFANKMARILWALLSSGNDYQHNYKNTTFENAVA
ncbi:MAG: IS110 family transposase [Alphaproteobacteria bacterium]|nr:IS110 family transposase [Alphaproteobacteria bacterium]